MEARHGNLKIDSENIFPIIKKWMYSDKDIFVREMISNASDAITKLKKLDVLGDADLAQDYIPRIDVIVNDKEKTLTFSDNGLGMTAEEVETYINQIAFSGATEFIEKYSKESADDQIIGHFGLGFYSAFMVADEVHIDTLSYKEDAEAVHWICDGSTEFDLDAGERKEVGTTITLFLNDDNLAFSNEYQVRETLEKYCAFMPFEIYVSKAGEEKKEEEKPVNDTQPLWTKQPGDCADEEYKQFYTKVFKTYKEPLFWIHLNMDYPFNLKGILYFPEINSEYDIMEGTIKFYSNQVFIADNIKEVMPDYLLLLKGVIDCPDIPLNVSRSALQNDGFVTKISDYISKKVADKLTGMFKTDRENLEKYWKDIHPFIKYGCLRDQKFADRMLPYILYKDINGKYLTIDDLAPKKEEEPAADAENTVNQAPDAEEEKERTRIYYVANEKQQTQYINLFREQQMNAVIMDTNIDPGFISKVENWRDDVEFVSIDSGVDDALKEDGADLAETTAKLEEVFRTALDKPKLTVRAENFRNSSVAAVLTVSEENRRMRNFFKMYGDKAAMEISDEEQVLTLNAKHPLVEYLMNAESSDNEKLIAEQMYDLARMQNAPLESDAMTRFVERSNQIMQIIIGNGKEEKS